MAWLFDNHWDALSFASVLVGDLAALVAVGLILAATVWLFGFVLFRLLEFLERS